MYEMLPACLSVAIVSTPCYVMSGSLRLCSHRSLPWRAQSVLHTGHDGETLASPFPNVDMSYLGFKMYQRPATESLLTYLDIPTYLDTYLGK